MKLSEKAKKIFREISKENVKLGALKKIAKDIRKDHSVAMELWSTKDYFARLLAVLIMDKKKLTQTFLESLIKDISVHDFEQKNQIADWLLANQLMKEKNTIKFLESWEHHSLSILRRLYWYYQARLRWTGKVPPANTSSLLDSLEENMAKEQPEVQWAMNFCAGQIGIHEFKYQSRCIKLGEKTGLYKNDHVSKGCTPNYLPKFIQIEFAKLKK